MKTDRFICALAAVIAFGAPIHSQDAPKPGPEHEMLKKLAGDWDLTMKAGGQEFKGKVNYKMEVGGLWLVSTLESEMFGQKFHGKGMDSYDAGKKKFTSVWVDSMSGSPLTMEGTYDKDKKTMTLTGAGPGMDGKPTKYKSVTEFADDNTMNFTMYMDDGKDPAFTIVYKKKR
jgi:hypothetical protein